MSTEVDGTPVVSHFQPWLVAVSYLSSLCGCLLTIELLHRRGTALGNLRSWYVSYLIHPGQSVGAVRS